MDGNPPNEAIRAYQARPQFAEFHDRAQRWAIIVAHRRAGKTVACVADLILQACLKARQRLAYVAPYYVQAKDVAWGYVRSLTQPFTGMRYNEGELKATFPNGSWLRLYGADNFNRMRGIGLDGIILDEFADFDPRAWKEVIRPALSEGEGWAAFIGTPRGHNEFYETWKKALADPDGWFSLMLKASQSGILSRKELDANRLQIADEDKYRQEFECDFEAAIQGAYYAKEMNLATDEGRICSVPHDPAVKVETWWDLGIGDATAIWFAQRVGKEVHLIDYYELAGVGLDHYAQILAQKAQPRSVGGLGYIYADHVVPHDAKARELIAGKTRLEVMDTLGLRPVVIPVHSVEDGISATRNLLPRCWWDAKRCERGVEALRQYRCEFDEERKVLKPRPLHDWTSHAADAFRYGAMHRPANTDFWKRKSRDLAPPIPIV